MLLAFFGGIGPTEMLVVGVVAVLLFGSRLPSVARSAGKSLTEFRRGMQDLQDEFRDAMNETERAASGPVAPQLRPPADDSDSYAGDEHDAEASADEPAEEGPNDGEPSEDELADGGPSDDGPEGEPAKTASADDSTRENSDPALAGGYPEPVKPPFGQ